MLIGLPQIEFELFATVLAQERLNLTKIKNKAGTLKDDNESYEG